MTEALGPGFHEQYGVTLVARTDISCPVMAQEARIAQIIDNLLTNAVSFTPTGGRVFITAQSHDDYVVLMVADEGPGLAPDTQEKIFERFYTDRSKQLNDNSGRGRGAAGRSFRIGPIHIPANSARPWRRFNGR